MNDQMLTLFSTYLDGFGTPEECKQVEMLIKKDPQAKDIFEEMKSWKQTIDTSKPEAVQAPPELRLGVMARLGQMTSDAPKDSTSGGGPAGSSLGTYWIAGTVLVGLVGGMMVYDYHKNKSTQKNNQPHTATTEILTEAKQLQPEQPQYRGRQTGEVMSVSPDEISGVRGNGDVYVSGQGRTTQLGGAQGRGRQTDSQLIDDIESKKRETLGLELSTVWEKSKISQVMQSEMLPATIDVDAIMTFSQKNNIHPGLLIAAGSQVKDKSIETIAGLIRQSLNQTSGQDEHQRLEAVMIHLQLDTRARERWLEIIRQ